MTVERLGQIIHACHIALARADLDPRRRAKIARILAAAQAKAREVHRC